MIERGIQTQRFHGPWSHPHTEQALDLLIDPYGNDRAQRHAALITLPMLAAKFKREPQLTPTIADIWENRR